MHSHSKTCAKQGTHLGEGRGAKIWAILLSGILLVLACSLTNCKSKKKSSGPSPAPTATPSGSDPILKSYAGISSVTNVTDTTATINWPSYAAATGFKVYYRTGEGAWIYSMYTRSNVLSYTVTGLTASTTYSFNVQAILDGGKGDGNQKAITVKTSAPPAQAAPGGVSLKHPEVAVSFNRTPTITAHFVSPGDTVRIYTDSGCHSENLVATGVVENERTNIDLTVDTLSATPADYTFYANSTGPSGITSACSRAFARYRIVACPSEDYVPVEGNFAQDTDAFCAMRVEARKVDTSTISTAYNGSVWVSASIASAKSACRNLSAGKVTCDLLSNPQWMTMAWDIESTAANWSSGNVGSGILNRGHSDSNPNSILSISDPTNDWSDTGNNGTWAQKRTHVLSNGSVLWDLAGNAAEWVDWTTGPSSYTTGPTSCTAESTDPFAVSCPELAPNDYLPLNPAGVATGSYTAQNSGLGRFYGTSSSIASGSKPGAAVRGEQYNKDVKCGVFALSLNQNNSSTSASIGFRCACTQLP